MDIWAAVLAILLSYLLGSIPTGLWLGLWVRGVDIREHGSKNIGATNTMRVLGKALGGLALLGDIGKGMAAVLLVSRLTGWPYAPLACGVASVLGHVFSVFCRFRGGKGVATTAGVFLALCPLATLLAACVFFGVFAATRMVSAGSITAALALVVAVWALPPAWMAWPAQTVTGVSFMRWLATVMALLVIVRHRSNIRRIVRGAENRI